MATLILMHLMQRIEVFVIGEMIAVGDTTRIDASILMMNVILIIGVSIVEVGTMDFIIAGNT